MGYPLVKITNSTPFEAVGEVCYLSAFCSNDDYQVKSFHDWTADSRGVCLVNRITATLKTPDGDIQAIPYESTGTSYSEFAIIKAYGGKDTYKVCRPVSVTAPDDKPADYVEPTEKQK